MKSNVLRLSLVLVCWMGCKTVRAAEMPTGVPAIGDVPAGQVVSVPDAAAVPSGTPATGSASGATAAAVVPPAARATSPQDEEIEEVVDVGKADPTAAWFSSAYPQIERSLAVPWPCTIPKFSLLLVVDHRTRQTWTKNFFADYAGFDAGSLKIGLGLRFGIWDGLDIGVYRQNGTAEIFDTYEFDVRYQPLHQERHWLDLAIRAGATWYAQPKHADAAGGFGQLLFGRTFFHRLTIATGLLFHSESSNDTKRDSDSAWSLAVPAVLEIRILSFLAWNLEVTSNVAGYGAKWPVFSSAVRFVTNRHTFSLVLANSQYTTADSIVANIWRGFKDLVIGFQLTRQWDFAN